MKRFLTGFLLPLLLLTAASLSWSLISLVNLIAFLIFQYVSSDIGIRSRKQMLSRFLLMFSLLVLLVHAVFHIILAFQADKSISYDIQWAKLAGLIRVHSNNAQYAIVSLVVHIIVALLSLLDICGHSIHLEGRALRNLTFQYEYLGAKLQEACWLLLPAIQLAVGISQLSWISLPYFIGSCVGLVDWSLNNNSLGLFRWWKFFLLYAISNIVLLYIYQLPIEFPDVFQWLAAFLGFYKISLLSDWSEICSGVSLLTFYIMLACIRCDLAEMGIAVSSEQSNLSEPLLPSSNCPHGQSRCGNTRGNLLLRGAFFRTFTINFFTYGFPVSLFALAYWSFQFASLFAFGLLAYVGYILYAFPSLFHFHRLNSLLLILILSWATSTYIFNLAFTFCNNKIKKDMVIWETIGLWHYSFPGLYLFAQFSLGFLVALGNLVNSSVFFFLSHGDGQSLPDDYTVEEKEEIKVEIVATIVWLFRKCSRAIVLTFILFIAIKPGFVHALYIIFFMLYLLRPSISRKMRQALILLCEAHFALLYILRLNLFTKVLALQGSWPVKILSQLGLLDYESTGGFLKIVILACFCAIHNHGFEVLFSFSAILQHTPTLPFGFSILKAGLNKSVLLSVYASKAREIHSNCSTHGIASDQTACVFFSR